MAAAVTLRRVRASNGRARVERMVHHRVRCHNFTSMKLRRTRATLLLLAGVCARDVALAAEPLPGYSVRTETRLVVSVGLLLGVR